MARISRAFIKSVTREVGQDIPIWEAKRYEPSPALAPSEKPIMEWRRWFAQFYEAADPSVAAPADPSSAALGS